MADIVITCPHCHQSIAADDKLKGSKIQCPLCQGVFMAPLTGTMGMKLATPPASITPINFRNSSFARRNQAENAAQTPSGAAEKQENHTRKPSNSSRSSADTREIIGKVFKAVIIIALIGAGIFGYFKFTEVTPETLKGNQLFVMTRKRANREGAGGINAIAKRDFFPIVDSKKDFFYSAATFEALTVTQHEYEVYKGEAHFKRNGKSMSRPVTVDRQNSFCSYRFKFNYSQNPKYLEEDADLLFDLAAQVDKKLAGWNLDSAKAADNGVLVCEISKDGEKKTIELKAENPVGKDNIDRVWVQVLKSPGKA